MLKKKNTKGVILKQKRTRRRLKWIGNGDFEKLSQFFSKIIHEQWRSSLVTAVHSSSYRCLFQNILKCLWTINLCWQKKIISNITEHLKSQQLHFVHFFLFSLIFFFSFIFSLVLSKELCLRNATNKLHVKILARRK